MVECHACDCSPGNGCLLCGGTGELPNYDECEPPEDSFEDFDDCGPLWCPPHW